MKKRRKRKKSLCSVLLNDVIKESLVGAPKVCVELSDLGRVVSKAIPIGKGLAHLVDGAEAVEEEIVQNLVHELLDTLARAAHELLGVLLQGLPGSISQGVHVDDKNLLLDIREPEVEKSADSGPQGGGALAVRSWWR